MKNCRTTFIAGMSYRAKVRLLTTVVLLLLLPHTATTAPVASEHEIKAAFLYNFGRFAKWPDDALGAAGTPFVIGLYNTEPFGDALDLIRGKTAHGRPVSLKICKTAKDAALCHVVLLNAEDHTINDSALAECATRPILTVGETSAFLRKGGAIAMYMDGGRVRIAVNTKTIAGTGVTLSSELLSIARLVGD